MKHSDYRELTGRLNNLAREAGRTIAILTMPLVVTDRGDIVATSTPDQDEKPFEVDRIAIWRAVEYVDNDLAGKMDSLADGFIKKNRGRSDMGHGATVDVRKLFDAMGLFVSATSTAIPGRGNLYEKTRKRIVEWMDVAKEMFPDLNPPFVRKLLASAEYQRAIESGMITRPFTWNGTKKDLACWLEANGFVRSRPLDLKVAGQRHDWSPADGVFSIKGRKVTAKQLQDSFKH